MTKSISIALSDSQAEVLNIINSSSSPLTVQQIDDQTKAGIARLAAEEVAKAAGKSFSKPLNFNISRDLTFLSSHGEITVNRVEPTYSKKS